jgi:catechol 2,3-dioxygenase-like lactoylglutathione lyase family enzyme
MTNLTYISPSFIVSDLKASIAFYVDKLGFEVLFIGPDGDPFWAIVGRENVSIFLKAIAPDIEPFPIMHDIHGHAGMHIFPPQTQTYYLKNTAQEV